MRMKLQQKFSNLNKRDGWVSSKPSYREQNLGPVREEVVETDPEGVAGLFTSTTQDWDYQLKSTRARQAPWWSEQS